MFSAKSKSQIINDLLASALDEFADGFEFEAGREKAQDYNELGPCEIDPDVGSTTDGHRGWGMIRRVYGRYLNELELN
jgi:hypothetical protein